MRSARIYAYFNRQMHLINQPPASTISEALVFYDEEFQVTKGNVSVRFLPQEVPGRLGVRSRVADRPKAVIHIDGKYNQKPPGSGLFN